MVKPTCKKIKEFIKDETAGNKVYMKYGLPNLAKDERKHRRILKSKLKKC